MPLLVYALLLVLGALAESTVGYRLDVTGGRLNLVLVLVTGWALLRGVQEGMLAGLIGGLALDMVSGTPFGLNAALLGPIGAVAALGQATFSRGGLVLFFGTAVLATVGYHLLFGLTLLALGWQLPGPIRLVNALVPTIVMNGIALPIVASVARRLIRSLSDWRRLELD
ncbi:MAG: rod shape-determining protein MreD [Chloroflexi bacterium]|nr:rod shape-determining protein MreD [Chloroflexota bacterium]